VYDDPVVVSVPPEELYDPEELDFLCDETDETDLTEVFGIAVVTTIPVPFPLCDDEDTPDFETEDLETEGELESEDFETEDLETERDFGSFNNFLLEDSEVIVEYEVEYDPEPDPDLGFGITPPGTVRFGEAVIEVDIVSDD